MDGHDQAATGLEPRLLGTPDPEGLGPGLFPRYVMPSIDFTGKYIFKLSFMWGIEQLTARLRLYGSRF